MREESERRYGMDGRHMADRQMQHACERACGSRRSEREREESEMDGRQRKAQWRAGRPDGTHGAEGGEKDTNATRTWSGCLRVMRGARMGSHTFRVLGGRLLPTTLQACGPWRRPGRCVRDGEKLDKAIRTRDWRAARADSVHGHPPRLGYHRRHQPRRREYLHVRDAACLSLHGAAS